MAETVHVPGVKQPMPKWAVFAGLGGVGVAIFLYYRSKKSASATAAAAGSASTTDQYPPDGTVGNPSDPYSTDPATGQTYGDEAVGAGAYGAYDTGGGGGGGQGLYTDPNGNTCTTPDANGYCPGSQGGGQGGPPFSTNAAWAAWVIQQEQNLGTGNIGAIQDALGLYLGGQLVDATQKQMIFDARAIAGDPPVAGTGNYPPNIRTSTGGKQNATNPVTGIKAAPDSDTSATLTWDASTGATGYQVNTFAGNSSFNKQKVTATTVKLTGMKAGVNYTTSVEALPAAAGTKPAAVKYTTKSAGGGGGGGGGSCKFVGGRTPNGAWDPENPAAKCTGPNNVTLYPNGTVFQGHPFQVHAGKSGNQTAYYFPELGETQGTGGHLEQWAQVVGHIKGLKGPAGTISNDVSFTRSKPTWKPS